MSYRVVKGKIERWTAHYHGPKFHAIFCDPPYHLTSITKRFGKDNSAPAKFGTDGVFQRSSRGFMGKTWDGGDIAFDPETWYTIRQHMLPGAFLIAFGGTRTWHRLAVAIEDAGFDIRDTICWLYGSGFPKSHSISKAIDRMQGVERDIIGKRKASGMAKTNVDQGGQNRTKYEFAEYSRNAVTPESQQWDGYGTALKPAWEPIIIAMNPLDGTFAKNALEHGVTGLNIDGGRIGTQNNLDGGAYSESGRANKMPGDQREGASLGMYESSRKAHDEYQQPKGRWPANLILQHHPDCEQIGTTQDEYSINRFEDGMKPFGEGEGHPFTEEEQQVSVPVWECVEECPASSLDEQSGVRPPGKSNNNAPIGKPGDITPLRRGTLISRNDTGGASRFFYQAKVSKKERNAGLENFEYTVVDDGRKKSIDNPYQRGETLRQNSHPTCKPIDLCKYLATLLLPPQGNEPRRILVPFSGSGSEMIGSILAGWDCVIGIEMIDEYVAISKARLKHWSEQDKQLDLL